MTQFFEVLLVEDNEGDVEMVRQSLSNIIPPCNLSVAMNGRDALDCLLKRNNFQDAVEPNLIFLDLNMPGMSGKEALKIIKSDDHLKTIPIIVFTSSHAPSDIQESYANHANCYLVKPFDSSEFKTAIEEVVNFWQNLAELPHELAEL